MSTHNLQSDTSRPIVKNPLLSGVAGSIDDFVNNTILLPAAEIPTPVELPSFTEPQDIDRLQRGNKYNMFMRTFFIYLWKTVKV